MPGALQPADRRAGVAEPVAGHRGHRQAERAGELQVALVVRGDGHDGPGAVAHQHVVREEHRDLAARDGIGRVTAGEHPGLAVADRPLPVADPRGALAVGAHRGRRRPGRAGAGAGAVLPGREPPRRRRARRPPVGGQRLGQGMLGGQDQVGRAGQRVRPGGERLDPQLAAGHGERDHRAVAGADPVALLLLDRLGPVEPVQVVEQPLRVGRDPQHPLPQRPPVDRVVADVAAPVGGDLLVGQHRAQAGRPVDHALGDVGQPPAVHHLAAGQLVELGPGLAVRVGRAGRQARPGLELGDQLADRPGALAIFVEPAVEDLQEDPLGPAVEAGVGGRELAPGVVSQAQPEQLPAHAGDVVLGADRRVLAGADRVLLGREPERVVAERVQDRAAGHAQEPAQHVGADVAERVPDVQARPARVGEEVEDVGLRMAGGPLEAGRERSDRVRGLERAVRRPPGLPGELDLVGQGGVVPERRLTVLVVVGAAGHRGSSGSGKSKAVASQ